MAVTTIQELIAQREKIQAKRQRLWELTTSLGVMVFKAPTAAMFTEADALEKTGNGNTYLIYNCAVEPNLASAELQKSFGVFEPLEIVNALFEPGEIARIAGKLLEISGYTKNNILAKVHEDVKN
mgnify:CR=1 FL=1